MKIYEVYYKGILVGMLRVKGNDYAYVPNAANVSLLESQGKVLCFEAKAQQTYDRPIKFYESIIQNGETFDDLTIGVKDDPYKMKEMN